MWRSLTRSDSYNIVKGAIMAAKNGSPGEIDAKEAETLATWMKELGPWDKDREILLPTVRRRRLENFVAYLNKHTTGTAKVVRVLQTQPYDEWDSALVDGTIQYTHKITIE
jgi:hypothetical protein